MTIVRLRAATASAVMLLALTSISGSGIPIARQELRGTAARAK